MRALISVCACATLILDAASCRSAAQFRVRWQPDAVLSVTEGSRRTQVSLRPDIAGCLGQVFDGSTGERYGSGDRRRTVLDVKEENDDRFILLSAVAAPNCNVQGRCGAADSDVTLIWLHVGADLSIKEKQVFAVENCREQRWVDDQPADWSDRIALTNGVLSLKFTEVPDAATPGIPEVSGRVLYDTRAARSGLQVSRVLPSRLTS